MSIPEKFALPAYSELTSWFVTLGHHGKWQAGEEVLNGKYAREMVAHRLIPVKSFIAKPALVMGGDRPRLDLRNQPSRDQAFEPVTLAPRPPWAYFDFPTIPESDIDQPATATYFKAIENTLDETDRPGRAFVYLWDEPAKDVLPKVARLARIAKANAPRLKVMVTTTPSPELEKDVDIFTPVMDWVGESGHPDLATYARLQKAGKEIWWYISCMSHGCDALYDSKRPDFVIDRPAAWVRAISWLSAKYSIDAFLYYSVVEGYRKFPERDPWKSLWDFSGNGDGTLFYPGRPGEHGQVEHGPIPSVRLKLWRESSYDAEYIRWMSQAPAKPDWWAPAFAALARTTTDWSHDYAQYQSLRDRAGDFLDGRK